MSSIASDQFLDEVHLLRDEEKDTISQPKTQRQRRDKFLPYSAALNVILLLIVASTWIFLAHQPKRPYIPNEIYSPAQSAVEYKTVVFSGGLHGDKTAYQGDSDQVNSRWEALYNEIGMSQISSESASHLPNATTPVFTGSSDYMVELDVFHQLHCLNLLRKLVYPKTFPMDLTSGSDEAEDNIYHMEHCYDQLRQSLQCSSDISTIYWEWSLKKKKMFGNLRTTHTCKNFDKIKEWALDHKLERNFDWWKEVDGAPIRTDPVSAR